MKPGQTWKNREMGKDSELERLLRKQAELKSRIALLVGASTGMPLERSLYTCSGCGTFYSRGNRKRPKVGNSNFCETCGTAEALRQADERRRAKKVEARRLHLEGMSISDIEKRLGFRKKATLEKWVAGTSTPLPSTQDSAR